MEQLVTRSRLEELGHYYPDGLPVTSVYLGLEPSRERRRAALVHFKDLVADKWPKVLAGRSRAHKATLEADVEACLEFLEKMPKVEVRGLAMYSCSSRDFFETIGVKVPLRPQIIVDQRPAVAPLMAALDEFKRIAVCLVDRRSARLYEYFMGSMEEVAVFSDDVPGRVKVGGWAGYESGRISRHVQQREAAHFKNVAEVLFEQFRLRDFDWLFLGARPPLRDEIERALHTYVRDRLKAFIDASVTTSAGKVHRLTMETAERLKSQQNREMARRLVDAANAGALAVTGVKRVLEALNAAAVGTLMLKDGVSRKGVACDRCGTLGLKAADCRLCGAKMVEVDSIVDKAVDAAFARGAAVRHVSTDSALDACEGIGALLRFSLKNGGA